MEKQWLGHPRGLATLFFTEMWERFSYYGMRALLFLYIVAPVSEGGLGFSTERAGSIYGWYVFAVYALSIPGGWIADRFLGLYRSVFVGGVIIALGHFSMAFPSLQTFYLGLCLISIGTGLLKPNVSSLVGTLYDKDDARRDAGFSIYYMGINIGAFIAPFVCGALGQRVDWHWGFAAAGVGMVFGLIQYVAGRRYLIGADAPKTDAAAAREEHTKSGAPKQPFTADEWQRILVIGILFVFSVLFWMAFEQAGSSLNLFAERYVDRTIFGFDIPASVLQFIQPGFVILLAPVIAAVWTALGRREPSSPSKFSLGLVVVGLGTLLLVPAAAMAQNDAVKVSMWWLVGVYFLHTVAELCLSPIGLSVTTKLAPPRIVGLMMGVWFLSISFGNKAAGYAAGMFDKIPLPRLFGTIAVITIAAGLILLMLIRPIKKLMGDVR